MMTSRDTYQLGLPSLSLPPLSPPLRTNHGEISSGGILETFPVLYYVGSRYVYNARCLLFGRRGVVIYQGACLLE